MNDFAASNGVRIAVDNDGDYVFHGGDAMHYVTRGGRNEQAFREMVQAEADERLGRWRDPERGSFVVYPQGTAGIVVLSESTGISRLFADREQVDAFRSSYLSPSAYAYFDAHTEPRPWDEAKPGDVWRFETSDDRRHALGWVAQDGTWDLMTPRGENVREVVEPVAWLVENWGDEFEGAKATRFVPEVSA